MKFKLDYRWLYKSFGKQYQECEMHSEPSVDICVAEKLGRGKETKVFPLGVWAHVCVPLMDDHCFVNLL